MQAIIERALYYAKAIYASVGAGLLYLVGVLGPQARWSDLGDVPVASWIVFVGLVLGVPLAVAGVTNGPKPLSSAEKELIARTAAALADPSAGAAAHPATTGFRKVHLSADPVSARDRALADVPETTASVPSPEDTKGPGAEGFVVPSLIDYGADHPKATES